MDDGPVNVAGFGLDTAAIEAAWALAKANKRPLYFPGAVGRTYDYNGNGLTGPAVALLGDDPQTSVIYIHDGKYLVDQPDLEPDPDTWGNLQVERLRFVGGAGAIRTRRAHAMVQGKMLVRDCEFRDYTGAAISTNTADGPNWTIENNVFSAKPSSPVSIGVALSGWTDSCRIVGNSFLVNRIHLKLGQGGNNAYVMFNDFLDLSKSGDPPVDPTPGLDRPDIWVVPEDDSRIPDPSHPPSNAGVNAGTGLYVGPNKFGNEGLDSYDHRVIYADEIFTSGAPVDTDLFGDRQPKLTGASAGFIRGHRFQGCAVFGGGAAPNMPFVYSMTKKVYGCAYENLTLGGTPPTYILQHYEVPDALPVDSPRRNLIGPVMFDGYDPGLSGFAASNTPATVAIVDPTLTMGGGSNVQLLQSCSTGAVGLGATVYFGPNGERTDWLAALWTFSRPAVITKLYVAGTAQPGGTASVVAVLQKQSAETPPTLTVNLGATDYGGSDTGHVPVGVDEYVGVRLTASAAAAPSRYRVVIEYHFV